MGLVDYISRHPSQKAKKVSAYDEEFIVEKLKLISASINSLELNNTKSAPHLHQLIIAHNPASQITSKIEAHDSALQITPKTEAHDLALQITPKVEAHDPALQITPKIEANNKAINLISTHAARVYKHVYYNYPAP